MTMTQNIIKILRVISDPIKTVEDKLLYLSNGKTLTSLLDSVGWKLIILTCESRKKVTSRIRLLHNFHRHLLSMSRRHGVVVTVKYLKLSALALSKFLAGERVRSYRDLDPDAWNGRLNGGLPTVIWHRTRDVSALHTFSYKTIRFWLVLFNLYRVIIVPGRAKLSTIENPFTGEGSTMKLIESWIELLARERFRSFIPESFKLQKHYAFDERASSSNSKSWLGVVTDLSLLKHSSISESFLHIAGRTLDPILLEHMLRIWAHVPPVGSDQFRLLPLKGSVAKFFNTNDSGKAVQAYPGLGLGQLFQVDEPAGKVRTFALVDSWTQTALLPLHVYLSELLYRIPNDGTSSHQRAFERVQEKSMKYGCSYGYDLSAATDRLPLSLQVALLKKVLPEGMGDGFAEHWARLLVGRAYYLIDRSSALSYKYAVGQPMGARSSFVMMALLHHLLVQCVSPNLGSHWEDRYEIVGDDIVIFDKDLASSYLRVMSEIGVEINLSKSVVAENRPVAEFVKRLTVKGVDVSPYSWKQFYSQCTNWLGKLSTVVGFYQKDLYLLDRFSTVFNTIMKDHPWDRAPLSISSNCMSIFITYALQASMKTEDIVRFLINGSDVVDGKLEFGSKKLSQLLPSVKKLIRGEPIVLSEERGALYWRVMFELNKYYKLAFFRLNTYWSFDLMRHHERHILLKFMGEVKPPMLDDHMVEALFSFAWYHNPAYSELGSYTSYPTSPLSDATYKSLRAEPYFGGFELLNELHEHESLYRDMVNKVSFLLIHQRAARPEGKEEVRLDTHTVRFIRILERILRKPSVRREVAKIAVTSAP